jgi:hypothetical protein
MEKFIECPTCAAKPGMPVLCESCQKNRQTINILEAEVKDLQLEIADAKEADDRRRLVAIKEEVLAHLEDEGALLSPRNIIQAMFTLHYAERQDGELTCGYER